MLTLMLISETLMHILTSAVAHGPAVIARLELVLTQSWCLWQALDVFLAGDDVPAKKPDPSIYRLAAERLGVQPSECLVIEDSAIGLQVTPFPYYSSKLCVRCQGCWNLTTA